MASMSSPQVRNARNIGAKPPKDQLNARVHDVGQLIAKLNELIGPLFEKLAPLFCLADDNTQNLNFAL